MRAAGQNLKRLLKKWGWGRRPWPTAAICAVPQPDWKEDEQQIEDAPRRRWARILVASMISLGSIRRLLAVETGLFSLVVVVQAGVLSCSGAHMLSFLLSFCGSLTRYLKRMGRR
jgi:hypothetical protein